MGKEALKVLNSLAKGTENRTVKPLIDILGQRRTASQKRIRS